MPSEWRDTNRWCWWKKLIPIANIEDSVPVGNFLGLFCLKNNKRKYLATCQGFKLVNCICHHCKVSETLLECALFLLPKPNLLSTFSPMTRFNSYISLTIDLTINYNNIFSLMVGSLTQSFFVIVFILIFHYDMNQNKFFIVISSKVFLSVHTSARSISISS